MRCAFWSFESCDSFIKMACTKITVDPGCFVDKQLHPFIVGFLWMFLVVLKERRCCQYSLTSKLRARALVFLPVLKSPHNTKSSFQSAARGLDAAPSTAFAMVGSKTLKSETYAQYLPRQPVYWKQERSCATVPCKVRRVGGGAERCRALHGLTMPACQRGGAQTMLVSPVETAQVSGQ